MSVLQLLSVLRARWKVALAVLIATVAVTVGVSLALPKGYTATTAVVVDVRPDPVAGLVFQGTAAASYLATQMDIMLSDRVARRVVQNLKLGDNPDVRQQWMEETDGTGSVENWIAGVLTKNLFVAPSRDSSVVNLSYTAGDPDFAATVANAFVQAYIDTFLDLRTDPAKRYSSFFDTRAKQLREGVEQAQARLSAYQREKGIIGTDERMDFETARLAELSTQLVAIQALSAESSSRSAQARVAGERMQEVMSNPAVAGVRADLSQAEARLSELNSRLGDNHPQVRQQVAAIDELRGRLRTEINRAAGSVSVTNNINRGREAEIRAAVEAQRARVLKLKGERDEIGVLQRDVENAQKAYEAIVTRLNQTSLESENTNANVSVLSPAVAPGAASTPKIALNAALAVVIGSILAVGAALLLEFLDRRVRSASDVVLALDLPVLGNMPKPGPASRLAGAHRPRIASQVLARLPQSIERST